MSNTKKTPSGFIGRIMKKCDSLGKFFRAEAANGLFAYREKESEPTWSSYNPFRKKAVVLKARVARLFETSLIVGMIDGFWKRMLKIKSKAYSAFFLTFSSVCLFVYLIKANFGISVDPDGLITPLVSAVFSVPLLFSDKTLGDMIDSGILTGFSSERRQPSGSDVQPYSPVLLLVAGFAAGLLTFFIPPSYIPLSIAFAVIIAYLCSFPESGFSLLIAVAPFMGLLPRPSLKLGLLVLAVFAGYFIKLIRGRRSFIGSTECAVFALFFLSQLLGAVSPGSFSLESAFIVCVMMLGFPLAVNLLRDPGRLESAAGAVAFSSSAVSVVGIVGFILGLAPEGWIDSSLFPEITNRCVSVFENPNMLSVYLAASFPFILYYISGKGSDKYGRFAPIAAAVLNLICQTLTFSRNGWLGTAVSTIVFTVSVSARSLMLVPVYASAAGIAGLVFPGSVGSRLLYFFSLSDSANLYRVRVWTGSVKTALSVFLTGSGSGDLAFAAAYLASALPGTESAPHSHSIYLQLLISTGILSLILFVVLLIMLLRRFIAFNCGNETDLRLKRINAAAFASLTAVALCGVFDNVFYNYRVMFLFWCIAGISLSACICDYRKRISSVELF